MIRGRTTTNNVGQQDGGALSSVKGRIISNAAAMTGSKTSASDTYAKLIRDQWDDYRTRFAPYEDQMIALANGQEDNLLSEQRAVSAAGAGFNSSMGTLGRDRQRLGLGVSAEEAANESRMGAGLRTAAMVGAANKARLHSQDRDNMILAGGLGGSLRSIAA